jgi:hypothetical protein
MTGTPIADLNLPKHSASLIGVPATYPEKFFACADMAYRHFAYVTKPRAHDGALEKSFSEIGTRNEKATAAGRRLPS